MNNQANNKNSATDNIIILFFIFFILMLEFVSFYNLYKTGFYTFTNGNKSYSDFFAFWSSGKMVLDGLGSQALNLDSIYQFQKALMPGFDQLLALPYAPFFLLYIIPFSLISYENGLVLWIVSCTTLYLLSIKHITKTRIVIIGALCHMPFFDAAILGQSSILAASLFGWASYGLLRGNSILTGICFGLLAFKPQYGIFIPIALIADRQFKVFLSGFLTVISLCAISILAFSFSVWKDFFYTISIFKDILIQNEGAIRADSYTNIYGLLRLLGLSYNPAISVQYITLLTFFIAIYLVWKRKISLELKLSLLIIATPLSLPYMLSYDLTIVFIAGALLYRYATENYFLKHEKKLLLIALLITYGSLIFKFQFGLISLAILTTLTIYKIFIELKHQNNFSNAPNI